MGSNALPERAQQLMAEEAKNPIAWWWLSFCDPTKPEGQQFLGACIVQARGFFTATLQAHRLGCNPGGECRGSGPIPLEHKIKERWVNRLLTKEECEEFDRVHEGEDEDQ
jgi:hypothetical protein